MIGTHIVLKEDARTSCVGSDCFDDLKHNIALKELDEKTISYFQWIKEKDCKESNQILQQEKCSIAFFLNTVLYPALVSNNFVEHLRKAWSQWQITKYLIEVAGIEIRMREDFQKDIKILCTSDTFLPIVELVSLPWCATQSLQRCLRPTIQRNVWIHHYVKHKV